MITATLLQSLYGIKPTTAVLWVLPLKLAAEYADLNTPQRLACFLAQIGHESGCLRFTKEIWGPTAQQLRYEPVTKLSKQLGNTEPGDGKRFMGRGLIQTTGRANYLATGNTLNLDLIASPGKLQERSAAAASAAIFWRKKNLNKFSDSYDFVTQTKRINGGLNGLAHRQALYTRAISLLKARNA